MRQSGVLLPISSLPSFQSKGSLGREAYRFVDFLATAKQGLWQISAPLSDPCGCPRNPSVFAAQLALIDVHLLYEDGLLKPKELEAFLALEQPISKSAHLTVLAKAVSRQNKNAADYLHFKDENSTWLGDYALFMALRETQGNRTLSEWPEAIRRRNSYALKTAQSRLSSRIEFWCCIQFFFYRQWRALKKYANAKGIQLISEMSFSISADSVEAWIHPELFKTGLDKAGPMFYDWPQHKRTRFEWWLQRLEFASRQADFIRLPYFQGFCGDWRLENKDTSLGSMVWKPGPGTDFVRALHRTLPQLKLITEDTSTLREDALALLAYSGFWGTGCLLQAFSAPFDKSALPHRHLQHMVLYTDLAEKNSLSHWQNTITATEAAHTRRYLNVPAQSSLRSALLHAAQASVAEITIIPLWDWLEVSSTTFEKKGAVLCVKNTALTHWLAAEMRELCTLYERLPTKDNPPKKGIPKVKPSLFQKLGGKEHG